MVLFMFILGREFFCFGERLVLDVRDNDFGGEINDLGSDGKVKHLTGDAFRVNVKLLRWERLVTKSKRLGCASPKVQERDQNMAKRYVHESSEEQRHVGSQEVEDKLLLHHCRMVRCID